MQGILEYYGSNGQVLSRELGKELTEFGQAILEWQPNGATWSIRTVAESGLSVNGRDCSSGRRLLLNHLDTFRLERVQGRFLRIPAPPQFKHRPCNEVTLSHKKLIIGRAESEATASGDERWNLDPEDLSVSKVHVEIQCEPRGFVIYDRSRTGTYLNGAAFQPRSLIPGDRFKIGSYFFEFTGVSVRRVDQLSGARIEGHRLVVEVSQKNGVKRILKEVSIEIKAGEFLGVLGGSGQGKSTLMNILGGLIRASDGEVIMDGVPLTDGGWRAGSVGFVPQDDIVHRELTVREAITLTARLRLNVPKEAIEALVAGIISRLGLQKQEFQRIYSLSGGQRKRVNIATELLARPPVLFLDEPTSGLDPENEEGVISTLQNLRLTGQTVVCTTHSLHKAYLFDRIAFIHDGRMMFLGTQDEARSHFLDARDASATDTAGPAVKLERIYKLLNPQTDSGTSAQTEKTAENWEKRFLASSLAPFRGDMPPPPRRVVPASNQTRRPGFLRGLQVLIETQWQILRADPRNRKSLLLQAFGIGILAGWVGRDDPEFRFFACLIATMWFGCSNAAQTITRELPIFRRERIAGLGLHAYILGKTAFLSIICWLQVLVLLVAQAAPVVVAGATRADPAGDIWPGSFKGGLVFVLAFALAGVVAVMIGLSISAHARTTTQATLWVPLVLIPQILFSGFVVTLPEMPGSARLFSYLVPSANAQRLLDQGNVADKQVPVMAERTKVPIFLWTDFGRSQKTQPKPKEVDGKFREMDEYNSSLQNVLVKTSKLGQGEVKADSQSDKFLMSRDDIPMRAGEVIKGASLAGIWGLCTWIGICYAVIFAGLSLAQPETLHPSWARLLTEWSLKRKRS